MTKYINIKQCNFSPIRLAEADTINTEKVMFLDQRGDKTAKIKISENNIYYN